MKAGSSAEHVLHLLLAILLLACPAPILSLDINDTILCSGVGSEQNHFLAVYSIFKNEGDILAEWIEHHIWQGVEHFYLIDNNSTDDSNFVLRPYVAKGYVTICHTQAKSPQRAALDFLLKSFQHRSTWIMQIDLDEFVFSSVSGMGIHHVLQSRVRNEVARIHIAWHLFGSSGLIVQPPCVRNSFTRRSNGTTSGKYIVRSKCASKLNPHFAYVEKCMPQEQELMRDPIEILLFHYSIMSKERFSSHKIGRGDVYGTKFDNVRTLGYFESRDQGQVVDDRRLADIIGPTGCFPCAH